MDNHRIKAVIFDLGNVLIDFDHGIAAQKAAELSIKTKEEISEIFFDSRLVREFEEGKISPRQFFVQIKGMLGLKMEYDKFMPIWNEIFFLSEKNYLVYDLARRLKGQYTVSILSNINILHFEYIKNHFSVLGAFDPLLTSFELGLRKPQRAIYQKALELLGYSPQEVFYTDDRKELVQSANNLGIRSFIFTSPQQLRQDLLASGVNL